MSNQRTPLPGVLLAVGAVLPITFIAVTTLLYDTSLMVSSCVHWGTETSGSTAFALGGNCSLAASVSETIPQAILRLTLIQGGILVSVVLGVVGVVWSHPRLMLFSSIILFAESIPLALDGLIVLTVLPGVFFLWSFLKRSASRGPLDTVRPKVQ